MTNKLTVKELALGFYYDHTENDEAGYDPDCKISVLMREIDEKLFSLLNCKMANEIEGEILKLTNEEAKENYILGFEKALEVCRIVYNQQFSAEDISKITTK